MLLKNKVALVTGATGGIGSAIAIKFTANGAKVSVAGRRAEVGQGVVDQIEAAGGTAKFVKLEVTAPVDWEHAVAVAKAEYGGLNILVNNAGTKSLRSRGLMRRSARRSHTTGATCSASDLSEI